MASKGIEAAVQRLQAAFEDLPETAKVAYISKEEPHDWVFSLAKAKTWQAGYLEVKRGESLPKQKDKPVVKKAKAKADSSN